MPSRFVNPLENPYVSTFVPIPDYAIQSQRARAERELAAENQLEALGDTYAQIRSELSSSTLPGEVGIANEVLDEFGQSILDISERPASEAMRAMRGVLRNTSRVISPLQQRYAAVRAYENELTQRGWGPEAIRMALDEFVGKLPEVTREGIMSGEYTMPDTSAWVTDMPAYINVGERLNATLGQLTPDVRMNRPLQPYQGMAYDFYSMLQHVGGDRMSAAINSVLSDPNIQSVINFQARILASSNPELTPDQARHRIMSQYAADALAANNFSQEQIQFMRNQALGGGSSSTSGLGRNTALQVMTGVGYNYPGSVPDDDDIRARTISAFGEHLVADPDMRASFTHDFELPSSSLSRGNVLIGSMFESDNLREAVMGHFIATGGLPTDDEFANMLLSPPTGPTGTLWQNALDEIIGGIGNMHIVRRDGTRVSTESREEKLEFLRSTLDSNRGRGSYLDQFQKGFERTSQYNEFAERFRKNDPVSSSNYIHTIYDFGDSDVAEDMKRAIITFGANNGATEIYDVGGDVGNWFSRFFSSSARERPSTIRLRDDQGNTPDFIKNADVRNVQLMTGGPQGEPFFLIYDGEGNRYAMRIQGHDLNASNAGMVRTISSELASSNDPGVAALGQLLLRTGSYGDPNNIFATISKARSSGEFVDLPNLSSVQDAEHGEVSWQIGWQNSGSLMRPSSTPVLRQVNSDGEVTVEIPISDDASIPYQVNDLYNEYYPFE